MRLVIAMTSGLLFGLGLTISDMINPARVLEFLDLFGGRWDPTLAFVMGGALLPMAMAWRVAARGRPWFGEVFPRRPSGIDGRLLGGAVLFGLGWGLIGLCPGPALAAVSVGSWPVWLFVAAMLAGMGVARAIGWAVRAPTTG